LTCSEDGSAAANVGEGEHQTRGRHHTTVASESADETGMQPGVNLFFTPQFLST
jgi:hypothetical protein